MEKARHVNEIIDNYNDLFRLSENPLRFTDVTAHKITTINNKPINNKQYRFPPIHKNEISNQVKELLGNNVIKASISSYNSYNEYNPCGLYLRNLTQKEIKDGEW